VGTVVQLSSDTGSNQQWPVTLAIFVPVAALTYWLYIGTVGSAKWLAFYLYPEGYLTVSVFGRVKNLERWEFVTSIVGIPIRAAGPRMVYRISPHRGRVVKFTELIGREELGPAMQKLQSEAGQASRRPLLPDA
jgi:hypothetical protein